MLGVSSWDYYELCGCCCFIPARIHTWCLSGSGQFVGFNFHNSRHHPSFAVPKVWHQCLLLHTILQTHVWISNFSCWPFTPTSSYQASILSKVPDWCLWTNNFLPRLSRDSFKDWENFHVNITVKRVFVWIAINQSPPHNFQKLKPTDRIMNCSKERRLRKYVSCIFSDP